MTGFNYAGILALLGVNLGALGSAIMTTLGFAASAQFCGLAANIVASCAAYCLALEMIMITTDYIDGN